MNENEYQQLASRTLIDKPDFEIPDVNMMLIWNSLGLAGGAGEVCEHIKKGVLHQHGIDKDKLAKELGDCVWYIAALCTKLGIDLGDVMKANIDKLLIRYPNGYSSSDSKIRVDVEGSSQKK